MEKMKGLRIVLTINAVLVVTKIKDDLQQLLEKTLGREATAVVSHLTLPGNTSVKATKQ